MTEGTGKWTEREISRAVYLQVFGGKHLLAVPNCNWTGHECDLLLVRNDLRLVDIEVKISRADLKADAKKEKWLDRYQWRCGMPYIPKDERPAPAARSHPVKIWKHYYCMPEAIWHDDLLACINPASGIMLIGPYGNRPYIRIHRQAKPAKVCDKIKLEHLVHICRLATVRMWSAYDEIDLHRRQRESKRKPRRRK